MLLADLQRCWFTPTHGRTARGAVDRAGADGEPRHNFHFAAKTAAIPAEFDMNSHSRTLL
jgi:hypothetical protein